jgi:hypothetical protein
MNITPDTSARDSMEAAAQALGERAAGHFRMDNHELQDECLQCASMIRDMKPAAPAPRNTVQNLLNGALGELLDALPERRDWLNPDVEKLLRAIHAGPKVAGAELGLRDLALLFAESHETGRPVTLSASACATLLAAMTTPPAQENRAVVLLTAAHTLLQKQAIAPTTINLLFETVRYDGTDCDGLCLISDIENELGIDGEASQA